MLLLGVTADLLRTLRERAVMHAHPSGRRFPRQDQEPAPRTFTVYSGVAQNAMVTCGTTQLLFRRELAESVRIEMSGPRAVRSSARPVAPVSDNPTHTR